MSEIEKKLDHKEFMSSFWRSCALQGCFNYERQQGLGFGYAMIPSLRRIYKDDPDGLKDALKRHLTFYNITPQCTTFVQGIVIAMEEEAVVNKDFDKSSINAVKTALMGPLSGIGDSIFWGTLRTIGLGIGISFCMQGSILGPILFLLIHNIPHWFVRYKGLEIGYSQGLSFMESASEGGMLESFSMAAKILGSTVVGAMIASMIKFTTTITLNMGNFQTLSVQSIFDGIMPKLLSLILAFGCFALIRKGKKATTVMLYLFILAFVISLLEGLPVFQG
ncbi:MAG: PTS system mannose/fructose/sorbose family transporter subunit IID [Erysipelotrichaceae bacterium]|nr:PTS system mannose/fructose/sorbose family transporter subunit IID [Erysipelotrichaceae bacterium]MDD4643059.1 PTS system mannose/fructose/sorbose family transporter subunit IID [Erysipelotrichaceae bacterium]